MTGIGQLRRRETLRPGGRDIKRADLSRVAVVIPALNEALNLSILLPAIEAIAVGQIVVADNGSTDETRSIVAQHLATWAYEKKRGYGAACHRALLHMAPSMDVVAFMDADLSVDAALIRDLVKPILRGESDFVLGARTLERRQRGSMSRPQRLANRLFPLLIRLGWGYRYLDMSPFRAIRRSSLEAIDMQDRAFGWTIEMQIKAVECQLRIREITIPYGKRKHGHSKISGTPIGVARAAYWIIRTCAVLWWTRRRRMR